MQNVLEGPPVTKKIPSIGLGEFLFQAAEKYGDKLCQIDALTGEKESFISAKLRSVRVALSMKARGVKEKDVILICSNNNINVVIPVLASLYLDGVIGSLDPSLSVDNVKHLLELVQPRMIFVEENAINLIENALVKGGSLNVEMVVFGKSDKYRTFESFVEPHIEENHFQPIQIKDCSDTAMIFFSSGTTGLPKGICLSHSALLYQNTALNMVGGCKNMLLHYTSLYWISASMMFITSYMVGSCRAFCTDQTPELFFKIVEKYKVTFAFASTTLAYTLANVENADKYDTTSLDVLSVGGSPCSERKMVKLKSVFRHTNVLLGYGMTEVGFISTFDPNTDKRLMESRPGSCGRVGPGLSLVIKDLDSKKILRCNEAGEICVKSKGLLSGYYNQSSVEELLDADGFLPTGDIGYFDEEGCLYVIDRIKEMFKYRAWHVVPSAMEAALLEHPAIREVVVFGVAHEDDENHPAAAIVPNYEINASDIHEFAAERLIAREQLRGGVYFVESLPKTPTGKILRRKIKEMLCHNLPTNI